MMAYLVTGVKINVLIWQNLRHTKYASKKVPKMLFSLC